MDILGYVLIILCIISISVVLKKAGLFKKNKKAKKQKEETKKIEQKTEKPVEQKADRSFKIVKKSKLSRVSKKALDTNSRTATIERVFERTPPEASQVNDDVYVQPLEKTSQELIDTVNNVETSDKKVISIKEIKEQALQVKTETQEQDVTDILETPYQKYAKAGEVTGEYTNIHLGANKPQLKEEKKIEKEEAKHSDELNLDPIFNFDDFIKGDRFGRFSQLRNQQNQEEKPKEIDFNDIVIADAILNPKYKQKKK